MHRFKDYLIFFIFLDLAVAGCTHPTFSFISPAIYPEDRAQIQALIAEDFYWLSDSPLGPLLADVSPSYCKAPSSETPCTMVWREGTQILGFISYSLRKDTGFIELIAVEKSYRRTQKQIAEKLMSYAIEQVQAFGHNSISLQTRSNNIVALAFFKRMGFRESRKDPAFTTMIRDQL